MRFFIKAAPEQIRYMPVGAQLSITIGEDLVPLYARVTAIKGDEVYMDVLNEEGQQHLMELAEERKQQHFSIQSRGEGFTEDRWEQKEEE